MTEQWAKADIVSIFLEFILKLGKKKLIKIISPLWVHTYKRSNLSSKEHTSRIRFDNNQHRLEIWGNFSERMALKLTLERWMGVSWRFLQGKLYVQRPCIRWKSSLEAERIWSELEHRLFSLSHLGFPKRDDWGQFKKHLKCTWPQWVLHLANQYSQTFSQLRWEDQQISKHKLICIELKNKSPNISLFQTNVTKLVKSTLTLEGTAHTSLASQPPGKTSWENPPDTKLWD